MITQIERFRFPQKGFATWLESWKTLQREGWDVTVLLAPDHMSAIGLAYMDAPDGQLRL